MKSVNWKQLCKEPQAQVDACNREEDKHIARLLALAGECSGGPPDLADRHNELLGLEMPVRHKKGVTQ